MDTKKVRIVDLGRGPQIEGHRLTVMDVFYYLHRGYDCDFIRRAMPSLTREQFDAVVEYVRGHQDELVEQDRRVDEFHWRGAEAQQARSGIFVGSGEGLTTEERAGRLKEKMKLAEKNAARHPACPGRRPHPRHRATLPTLTGSDTVGPNSIVLAIVDRKAKTKLRAADASKPN